GLEKALSPAEFREFKLKETERVSHNTQLYRFELPSNNHETGLTVASCLVARAVVDGKKVVRPYTPVSLNHQRGYVDLLVKTYPAPGGRMSRHIEALEPGQALEMKGPFKKVDYKANMHKKVGMIAGGTGITPMLQVIREVLSNPQDHTEIHLVFANVTEDDILLRDELDALQYLYPAFHVYYTLDKPPSGWTMGAGFVSADIIKAHLPSPEDDCLLLVCGPKGLVAHVAGDKGPKNSQGDLGGLLKQLGFAPESMAGEPESLEAVLSRQQEEVEQELLEEERGKAEAIVRREIEPQKERVKEAFQLLEGLRDAGFAPGGSGAQPAVAEVAAVARQRDQELLRYKRELASAVQSDGVFPSWLTARSDFQYVFPRYATQPIDSLSLVAFAMSKEVKQRTSFDIDHTLGFMQQFSPFCDMATELVRNLCKLMRLVKYAPGAELFSETSPASHFGMILHGEVEIFDPALRTVTVLGPNSCFAEIALSDDSDRAHSTRCLSRGSSPPQRSARFQGPSEGEPRRSCSPRPRLGDTMGVTFAGGSGAAGKEDAEQQTENDWSHHPVPDMFAGSETIVLELAGQDFRATSKLFNQTQNSFQSKFLQTHVELFRKWSKHRINQIAPLLVRRSYKPGEVVQKSGDPATELYFVLTGQCKVEREIVRTHRNKWPVLKPGSRELQHQVRETRVTKSVQLANVGPGQYFGEEFLVGFGSRRTTVTAQRLSQILVLRDEDAKAIFTTRMREEMRRIHHAMFTSDEAILAKYEREQKLRHQFQLLKRSALGPLYEQRVAAKRDQARDRRRMRGSQSAPALVLQLQDKPHASFATLPPLR
ncbi:NADH-cytochrome b5 reductase-like protein (B5R), partial [Durusdinium trenchii]